MKNVYKLILNFHKNKKGLMMSLLLALIFLLSNFFVPFINKRINIVDGLQDTSLIHEDRIANLENDMDIFLKKGVVYRDSWNDYIHRKDTEYHQQMTINNDLYLRMGFFKGLHAIRAADE